MPPTFARRLRLAVPAVAIALAAIAPGTASAGPLVASASNCDTQTLSQAFLPWADVANYTLDPGGSFEPGTPKWSLSGADATAGNEPFFVADDGDGRSLTIASGESATSPVICVGLGHPDIRFFSKASTSFGQLNVEVLFEDAAGNVQTLSIGATGGNTSWSPTAPMPIVANL